IPARETPTFIYAGICNRNSIMSNNIHSDMSFMQYVIPCLTSLPRIAASARTAPGFPPPRE
ncbi:MAG: hypothetical protein NT022_09110, partial [Deltaproteobacteria bacterium]|nr:hypothetical protein [Deltaproteobacteria bacterium]